MTTCPLCAATTAPHYFQASDWLHGTAGEFVYRRCAHCSTVFQSPRVVPEDLPACYPPTYYTHADQPQPPANGFRDRVRAAMIASLQGRCSPWDSAGLVGRALVRSRHGRQRVFHLMDALLPRDPRRLRALDVGCGGGAGLITLARAGWDVEGVEWDPAAADVARRVSGKRVTEGNFLRAELPPRAFDLVVLSHVFEHIDDPVAALRRIHELLRPGGRAVLLYPNPRAIGARRFGRYWVNWDAPRHLVVPPLAALCRAAREIGFDPVHALTLPGTAAFDLAYSRAHRRCDRTGARPAARVTLGDRCTIAVERVLVGLGFTVGEHAVAIMEARS